MNIPYIDSNAPTVSITVKLPYSANVYLVDQRNYDARQRGNDFRYYGGYYTQSPITINAPNNSHNRWFLIVDNPNGDSFNYSYHWN